MTGALATGVDVNKPRDLKDSPYWAGLNRASVMASKEKKRLKKPQKEVTKDKRPATTSSYTRLESIPILYPNNPSSYRLWYEASKIYFPREYGPYGSFITTKKPYKPQMPTLPRRVAEDASDEGSSDDSGSEDDEENHSMDHESEKLLYRELIKEHAKATRMGAQLAPQIYAALRSNLSDESVQLLSQEEKFTKYEEGNNYCKLLKLIQKTHGGAKTGWDVKDRIALNRLVISCYQKSDESLLVYKNRFASLSKSCTEFTEQELAVIFIENMNSRSEQFKRDKSNLVADERHDEYPKSVEAAFRSASRYSRSAPAKTVEATTLVATSSSKKKKQGQPDKKASGEPKGTSDGGSGKPNKYPCTTCELLGKPADHSHFPNHCPHKDEVRKLLASANSGSTMMTVGFEPMDSGVQLMMGSDDFMIGEKVFAVRSKLTNDEVVLDNGSTINLFGNHDLLSNKTNCNLINIRGVGGEIQTSSCGTFAGILMTYTHASFKANVLSQARVEDLVKSVSGASLKYDEETFAFTLGVPSIGCWVFERRDDLGGLRVAKSKPQTVLTTTVAERRKRYTKRELKGADNARELLRRANFPSDKSLAHLVNSGNLLNSPVTSSDIHRATAIDGGDIPSAMGKATKAKPRVFSEEPSPVTIDRNVQLEGDIFFVDSEAFLLTVSNFGYGMGAYLGYDSKGTREASNIWKYLSLMFAAYAGYGFNVASFSCDRESGLMLNRENVEYKEITFNPKAPDAKCPRVERRIRTCKERDRCTRASLPFKLFGTLLVYSVLNNLRCINLFPCAASPHVAPREMFCGIRSDFKRDFPVAFGDYCLTYDTKNKVINSSNRRLEECIALLPTGNKDGDVNFYNLRSGKLIARNRFKMYPFPDSVIDHLNRAYSNATKRDYSLPPVYRTIHYDISDDVPIEDLIEMEPPEPDEIPMHGREPEPIEDDSPIAPDEDQEQDHSPVEECEPENQPEAEHETEVESHDTPMCAEGDSEVSVDNPSIQPDDDLETPEVIPATDLPERRYPKRENRTTWRDKVFHISVKNALRQYGRKGLVSMVKEIRSVAIEKQALIPVNPNKLSKGELKSIISSSLFLKEKFSPDGTFEKLKARLVAGGHLQNRELYEQNDISSPTVGTSSVMTVVAIAAKERRHVVSADIGVAYLNANLPKGKTILMRLSKENAAILVWLKPEYGIFLQPNGTMIVRLTKALYGCIESAKLWYNHICSTLESQGYVRNPIDVCVFNKLVSGVQCTICIHVDDLLITCVDEKIIESTLSEIQKVYKQVTIKRGKVQQYLGMMLDFSVEGKCYVTMPKFTDEVISKSGVSGVAATPALETLFTIREEAEKLDKDKAEYFHSTVAMCQYLAKRTRPDILLPVVFLSTRVTAPDVDDLHKLERVVKYVNATKLMGICIEPAKDGIINIRAYVDASFAVHKEFRSHTGIVVTFGGGGIYFRSTKQRLNTTSSTEAELVAVSDALPYVIHIREFLIHQGYDLGDATLFQDNMSTIKLIENGRSNSDRTRHINIRFFFVSDRVKSGEVSVKYMPTDEMIADILTKPLQGEKFRVLRQQLLNWDKP